MAHILIRFALAALAFALSAGASADEVRLRNGDRLSGRVVSKSGELLEFETPYAGKLKIKWKEVTSLSTDAPVLVLVEGGSAPLRTRIAPADGSALHMVQTNAYAQLGKIQFINPKPEESGTGISYGGHVNVSAANSRGNNLTNRFYGDARFTARAKPYRYALAAKLNRASESGLLSASSWLGSGNYDRYLNERRFLYLRGSLEHDSFKDINRRRTLGGGYGTDLVRTERATLTVRGGADQVHVDHLVSADESFPALGWGLHATYRVGHGAPELFHEQDGYWNLARSNNLTVRSRTGLRIPLFDNLSASLQLNLDWDRAPAPGRKPVDSTLLLGAAYSW